MNNIDLQKRVDEEGDSDDDGIISQFVMDIDQRLVENNQNNADNDFQKVGKRKKSTDLSVELKWALIARYYEEANRKSDRLFEGSLDEITEEFSVSKRTVQHIVKSYKTQILAGIKVPDFTNKKVGRTGGSETKMSQEVLENIRKLKSKTKSKLIGKALAEAYEREYGSKLVYPSANKTNKAKQVNKVVNNSHQQQYHNQHQPGVMILSSNVPTNSNMIHHDLLSHEIPSLYHVQSHQQQHQLSHMHTSSSSSMAGTTVPLQHPALIPYGYPTQTPQLSMHAMLNIHQVPPGPHNPI